MLLTFLICKGRSLDFTTSFRWYSWRKKLGTSLKTGDLPLCSSMPRIDVTIEL